MKLIWIGIGMLSMTIGLVLVVLGEVPYESLVLDLRVVGILMIISGLLNVLTMIIKDVKGEK
jgi:hypothetical protein